MRPTRLPFADLHGCWCIHQCTKYVKDKEEIALDEELADKRGSLQRTFNERAQHAAELKERGNTLLRAGSVLPSKPCTQSSRAYACA